MHPTRKLANKKNLLLGLDAYGTLFTPKAPVATQYGEIARRHGIQCPVDSELLKSFRSAFKDESKKHPNYGKAVGMGAETWWGNVIRKAFHPFLGQNQDIPNEMISDLIVRFSTKEGYMIYPDVLPFFEMLRNKKLGSHHQPSPWKWDRTVVGVITNSDDRVPGVLHSLGLRVGPRRVSSTLQRTREAHEDEDVSFVVLSYDVGHEKPDRRIFDAAKDMLRETLAESGTDPGLQNVDDFEMLFVGDDMQKDYFGAQKAGWNAVAVDRTNPKDKPELLPHDQLINHTNVETDDETGNTVLKPVQVVQDLRHLSHWSPS